MVSVPVALSCESRSRLGCFDATSRVYLKTRTQENGITGNLCFYFSGTSESFESSYTEVFALVLRHGV